ncbi:DUF1380 domain-containing protein [Salmonella enterica subsp. enterica serovar Enteritidis]|uniref:DUF1380 domain-containing protein n=1 Tax=Salmonella enteritidis TaxID=149539 RepID=A0A638MEI8_SALEN|nr:DUF1380 domain-containing protein [Salmonella enterica subsp. enterica serovar Enteritidis]EBQ5865678.1 DUF1380 domain-containing protein [Salmonella enterica subsp. enterica serovar Enteritidis]EBW9136426.1 DUF1380 domain-containing protein [Salmonella enterica subsp. enterica serovar Enteritidis]EBZ5729422.1 DUF1380 domain-containing protein [Salmonella enterica subsp. enterica serovar Enteritidis]EBZ8078398.1 DUF1380 domain-containing protein [Salmonella enterica subsp. enterica serovar E
MMYGTRQELNKKLKRVFGNDERFALLVWTKQDVMSLTQAMTEVEADAILREIGRKGMGEHTGDGISDSTVQALYAGLWTEIPTVSVPTDLLARITDIAGRALDTEDAQAWPLVCRQYPSVADAQADIARLRQQALAA